MKKLLIILIILFSFILGTLMIGCGKKGGNSGGNNVIYECPAGYEWDDHNEDCVLIQKQSDSLKYEILIGQQAYAYQNFNGEIFKRFLAEAFKVCDRDQWGLSPYYNECDNWLKGVISIQFDLNQIQDNPYDTFKTLNNVRFYAQYPPSWFNFYAFIDWDTPMYNPFYLSMNVDIINNQVDLWNSQYLPGKAYNKILYLYQQNGKIGDPTLYFKLIYDNQPMFENAPAKLINSNY